MPRCNPTKAERVKHYTRDNWRRNEKNGKEIYDQIHSNHHNSDLLETSLQKILENSS